MIACMPKKRSSKKPDKHRGRQVTFCADDSLVDAFTNHVERQHSDRSESLRRLMVEYLRGVGVNWEREIDDKD